MGLEVFFEGEGNAFAAVEDEADNVEEYGENGQTTETKRDVEVGVDLVRNRVQESRAEPDKGDGPEGVLDHFAAEGSEEEGDELHLEDACGELEEFEGGGGGADGRDHDGEEFLALEAVAEALVALAVDALEKEEFAAGAADGEGNQRAEGRCGGGHEAVEKEFPGGGVDVEADDAVHRAGDGDEGGVQKGQAAEAPDAEGKHEGVDDQRELVQEGDGMKFHADFILPSGRGEDGMVGVAGEEVEGVGEKMEDGAEGGFGSAGAAGEIEDEGVAGDAADAAAEGGEGGVLGALLADELGEAGDEAGADGEGGLGCDVAGGEAGAAGGEDEISAGGRGAKGRYEGVEFVGKK